MIYSAIGSTLGALIVFGVLVLLEYPVLIALGIAMIGAGISMILSAFIDTDL